MISCHLLSKGFVSIKLSLQQILSFSYENMPAYSNTLRILPTKNENVQMKNSGSFHISAQNIYCGYSLEPPQQGSSNKYSQSMFLSRNKKINVYPSKPQFYCIKMGFKGVKTIYRSYHMYLDRQAWANSIDQMRRRITWRLIWVYTVWHSSSNF